MFGLGPHKAQVREADPLESQRIMNQFCMDIASNRAMLELARRHPEEYEDLLRKELATFQA